MLPCTIVGASIGHQIPRRGDVELTTDIRAVPRGADVAIVYRPSREKAPNVASTTVEGVYGGIDDDRAIVERGDQAHMIPLERIEQTRVSPWKGGYSLEGGFIGFGLDLVAVALYLGMFQWNACSGCSGAER